MLSLVVVFLTFLPLYAEAFLPAIANQDLVFRVQAFAGGADREALFDSLDAREKELERKHALGMEHMKRMELEPALEAFDRVLDLRETTYLWQRGMALYYLNRFEEADNQFSRDIKIFEDKFEDSATDERLWQVACRCAIAKAQGKPVSSVTAAELQLKEYNPMKNTLFELFSGALSAEDVHSVLAEEKKNEKDFMGRQFFYNFYLGLWYESQGDEQAAKQCMLATQESKFIKSNDLWYFIPKIHISERGW